MDEIPTLYPDEVEAYFKDRWLDGTERIRLKFRTKEDFEKAFPPTLYGSHGSVD